MTKKTNGKKTDEKVRNDSTRNTESRMEGAREAKEAEPGKKDYLKAFETFCL